MIDELFWYGMKALNNALDGLEWLGKGVERVLGAVIITSTVGGFWCLIWAIKNGGL